MNQIRVLSSIWISYTIREKKRNKQFDKNIFVQLQNKMHPSNVPDTVPSSFCIFINLILVTTLLGRYNDCVHFTDEEPEAQRASSTPKFTQPANRSFFLLWPSTFFPVSTLLSPLRLLHPTNPKEHQGLVKQLLQSLRLFCCWYLLVPSLVKEEVKGPQAHNPALCYGGHRWAPPLVPEPAAPVACGELPHLGSS